MTPEIMMASDFDADTNEIIGRSSQHTPAEKNRRATAALSPYLKWAGSKRRLVSTIVGLVPTCYPVNRLIEPFVGSGAVALNIPIKQRLLADINADVVATHTQVIADPRGFIARLEQLFTAANNTEDAFKALRTEFNESTLMSARRAALFVYLNRHCFNGLVRYSSSGRFNTSFGRYQSPHLPRSEIIEFASTLRNAVIVHSDFRAIIAQAGIGDLVYCDPPYLPMSDTANFTHYSACGFSLADQQELAGEAEAAASRGAYVIVSNHDTPVAREL